LDIETMGRMPGDIQELEIALLLQALHGRTGVDFSGYEEPAFKVTLDEFVRSLGLDNISALQGRLLRDDLLGAAVVRMLGKSVDAYFADPNHLMALRCSMLPLLRSSPWPSIWLADCFDVKLAIALLVCLEEEGLREKTQVFATSSSEALLAEVNALQLSAAEMSALDEYHKRSGGRHHLREYFTESDDRFSLRPALRSGFFGCQHDIATDASFREFQAIVCARPMGQYGNELRRRALSLFSDSLCGFGILQIDLQNGYRGPPLTDCFAPVLVEQGIFRRLAG
jgi:chemotaxis protein methyltransferase CheR